MTSILVVDDDVALCDSLDTLLTLHGFRVLISHQSMDALHKPEMISGRDFAGPCSARRYGWAISLFVLVREITAAPVIMLTGWGQMWTRLFHWNQVQIFIFQNI